MKKWEYKIEFDADLNGYYELTTLKDLGGQGWELVSACKNHHGVHWDLIFKRELKP